MVEIMDYKEKYEQAMLRMNKWVEGSEIIDPKEVAEFVFPELKESEDLKIKRDIQYAVRCAYGDNSNNTNSIFAWLEKQGEQPNKVSIWKHWKDGIAGNGEGKTIFLVKNGNTYSISSCLVCECDYIELSELDKLMVEKQGEQKSTWSEDDKRMIDTIIYDLERHGGKEDSCYSAEINWLKSLKERYTWKPTDEQMEVLNWCKPLWKEPKTKAVLESLIEDLKKLKGE